MKFLVVLAALLLASVLAQTPPKIPQQITADITVSFPNYPSPTSLTGYAAIDAINAGAFVEIGGSDYVPVSFHTNLAASPDGLGNIFLYTFEGPLCWNWGSITADVLQYYPFQIDANATYLGSKAIEGQLCGGWAFDYQIFPVRAWVSVQTNILVKLQIGNLNLGYVQEADIVFSNTVIGAFDPSIYAPPFKTHPSMTCELVGGRSNDLNSMK